MPKKVEKLLSRRHPTIRIVLSTWPTRRRTCRPAECDCCWDVRSRTRERSNFFLDLRDPQLDRQVTLADASVGVRAVKATALTCSGEWPSRVLTQPAGGGPSQSPHCVSRNMASRREPHVSTNATECSGDNPPSILPAHARNRCSKVESLSSPRPRWCCLSSTPTDTAIAARTVSVACCSRTSRLGLCGRGLRKTVACHSN